MNHLASFGRSVRRIGGRAQRRARAEIDWRLTRGVEADLALFHGFEPPPAGGGHQFLRALVGELERRRLVIEPNRISGDTPACLFNSFNFDFERLRRFARSDCRLVHRVDGPIGVYRGFDDGTDERHRCRQCRACARDGDAVAVQPREARGARDRAS